MSLKRECEKGGSCDKERRVSQATIVWTMMSNEGECGKRMTKGVVRLEGW
jgi:hypothetical protein